MADNKNILKAMVSYDQSNVEETILILKRELTEQNNINSVRLSNY